MNSTVPLDNELNQFDEFTFLEGTLDQFKLS